MQSDIPSNTSTYKGNRVQYSSLSKALYHDVNPAWHTCSFDDVLKVTIMNSPSN